MEKRVAAVKRGARVQVRDDRAGRTLRLVSGPAPRSVTSPLPQRLLVLSVASLCLLGLPVVLSASAVPSLEAGGSVYSLFERQGLFLLLGLVCALAVSRVPLSSLRKLRFVLPMFGFTLLVAVFLPGLGHDAGGSSRWIGAGPIQIQPSELMKLAVVIFAADLLARRAARPDPRRAVVQPLLFFAVAAGILIMKQPDLGTCIVIFCIVFSLMFAAGLPARLVAASALVVAVPGAVLALDAPYRRARLLSFINPFAHASTTGYQVVQSLVTLGQGGLRGNGIGASPETWGYLPNGHTDFIFAVLGGNLGLIGTLGVIALFAVFAWAGFTVARQEKDPFARYLAVGVTCWIIAQAVINIGGVIDVLPVTGIPLPFVSYGGSALVAALSGAGILIGIARRQLPAQAPAPATVRRPARSHPAPLTAS